MLFPNLDPDEGRERIEAAIVGAADLDTWRRIEDVATREPDLFTYLFEALEDLHAERALDHAAGDHDNTSTSSPQRLPTRRRSAPPNA